MLLSDTHDQVYFMLFHQTYQPHISCTGEGCVKTYRLNTGKTKYLCIWSQIIYGEIKLIKVLSLLIR